MESRLCRDMIEEILLRLPVKSLIRFKCVRKSWFSLISDPHFAISHFELSASPSHRLLCMSTSDSETRSFDIEALLRDVSPNVARTIRSPLSDIESVSILGSCRGFVLLGRYSNLCLWNPSTDFHRNLLCPGIDPNTNRFLNLFGLGYDPSTNDYLAVVSCQSGLVLFSFRTNSWKEIGVDCVPYVYHYHHSQCGLFFNGAIHWLAYRVQLSDEMIDWDEVIVVFDLIKRNLSEISMPIGDFTNGTFRNLLIMGGCLSVSFLGNSTTQMWVMKEYKVHTSWTEIPPTKHLSHPHICYSDLVMYTESLLSLPIDCGGSMKTIDCGGSMETIDCGGSMETIDCDGSMETTCQQKQTRRIRVCICSLIILIILFLFILHYEVAMNYEL